MNDKDPGHKAEKDGPMAGNESVPVSERDNQVENDVIQGDKSDTKQTESNPLVVDENRPKGSWLSDAKLYCPENGRSHGILWEFLVDDCALCGTHLGPPTSVSNDKVASDKGKAIRSSEGAETKTPEVVYAVEYLDSGDGLIGNESWEGVFDMSSVRQNTSSPFEIVTVLRTSIPPEHNREPYQADQLLRNGILNKNNITVKLATTRLTIFSAPILQLLRRYVRYYPAARLDAPALQLEEPFSLIAHHYNELDTYRKENEGGKVPEEDENQSRKDEGADEMKHLEFLLTHFEKTVMGDVRKEQARHEVGTCTFRMLWLLYKPGITVYLESDGHLAAFVVQAVKTDPTILSTVAPKRHRSYKVRVWSLDFDGKYVGRVDRSITIAPFEGDRPITSLKLVPCEIFDQEDGGKWRKTLEENGKKWYELLPGGQVQYSGPVLDESKRQLDGRVYIDHASYATYSSDRLPGHLNGPYMMDETDSESDEETQPLPIRGPVRHRVPPPPGMNPRPKFVRDMGGDQLSKCQCEDCRGLRPHPPHGFPWVSYDILDPTVDKDLTMPGAPEGPRHRYLLCGRLLKGFDLNTRTWVKLDVAYCKPPRPNLRAIDTLVMPSERKDMIKALIQKFTNSEPGKARNQAWKADYIENKGDGRIFLLHGSPGVGKTYTAECIAEYIDTAGRVQARSKVLPKMTPDEKLLAETAQMCIDAAEKLKVETDHVVKLCQKGKFPKAIHATFRSSRHRGKIERLEKTLQQCRQVMETELLFKVCNKSDAIQLQQTSGFQSLESDIQNLVSRIAQGCFKVEDLVKVEHHITRDIVRDEGRTTREQVTNHVTSEVQALATRTISDKQREQLLKSLKAPEMNQRYHKIMGHADATFERIFLAYEGLASKDFESPDYTEKSLAEVDETWGDFTSWLQSKDNRIFWVRGKPGSGKSTLMKFVIESHQTRQLLGTWNPGSSIISHFFWKIGSSFQNTIHGLLCGFLYQMLSHDNDKVDQVLSHFNAVSSKDSPYDWSDSELQAVLLFVLRLQTHSTCIFIDGLDEVSNKDGYLKLLNVVEELNLCNNVKVCVSSRPETQLVNRLGGATSLRLEDLTRPDMTAYVGKKLLDYRENGHLSESMDKELTDMLLDKAQGVFLWLSLAVNSVISGIQNSDTHETLVRRLSELPEELEELYTDMWTRLNGNNSVYRLTAARYFRYVIAGRKILLPAHPDYGEILLGKLTLAEIAIAESLTVNEYIRLEAKDLALEELKGLCTTTVDDIQKRCAGLLQLLPNQRRSFPHSPPQRGELDYAYFIQEPDFIHRTAHDFLVETEAGQRILNCKHDLFLSVDTDVRIFKSITRLAATLYKHYDIRFTPSAAISICARLAIKDYGKTSILYMLETLMDLHSQRILALSWDYEARSPSHHFVSQLVVESPILDNFIEPLLREVDSSSAATDVLRDITDFWVHGRGFSTSMASGKLVHEMLGLGADPHIRGLSHIMIRKFNPYPTAFGLFLLGSLQTCYSQVTGGADSSEMAPIMRNLAEVLYALARTCPNWHERLLVLGEPNWLPDPLRAGTAHMEYWVVVEVDLQFLLTRFLAGVPIRDTKLHELANHLTKPFSRIRHIGYKSKPSPHPKCWRIKNQRAFRNVVDLVFRPMGFQKGDLDQFINIVGLSGNAEEVLESDEVEALAREVPSYCRLRDLGIYPQAYE